MTPSISAHFWWVTLLAATLGSCNSPQKKGAIEATANRYAEHVRTTPFQTPAQQVKSFKLPPGFEISLFASEPMIGKPMNIEFDDRGRLWITQSTEYPMAASEGIGKDKIVILEDTNGDGKADKFTDFKSDLNIPIGIMPMADGAIAYSIPNVYYFRDTDGDGQSDQTEKLLGPFDYSDTHGMVNNFIRGYDGWVHSSHGFSNTSRIAGGDGDSLVMVSGNTFRFRTDGSRAEQTTFGRVNPFGFAYDERGYLYSVDCHSKPLYQLIPKADYPHFGKTSSGIGFAPEMTGYELGSTALSGLAYYTARQFPAQYRNNFFIGDVVTSRISRNSVSFSGSTPILKFEEDFLLSDDPWFRPVDIKVGPDGAIYVADFYNRIIGHYEVGLQHPGRDRTSGRIWRITYKGGKKDGSYRKEDWSKASLEKLLAGLEEPQLNIRMRMADRIFDTFNTKAAPALRKLAELAGGNTEARIQALWLLYRLDALDDTLLTRFLNGEEENLRIHGLRVAGEGAVLNETLKRRVLALLEDSSPFVRRSAAEVLANFPSIENLTPLIRLYQLTPAEDSHLKHTALLGVRRNLMAPSVSHKIYSLTFSEEEQHVLVKAATDLPDKTLANFMLAYLLSRKNITQEHAIYLQHVASQVTSGQAGVLALKAVDGLSLDDAAYLSRLEAMAVGIQQSGRAGSPEIARLSQAAACAVVRNFAQKAPAELHVLEKEERNKLIAAIKSVGRYRMKGLDEVLLTYLPEGYPLDLQGHAMNSLVEISSTAYTQVFEELIQSPGTANAYKEKLVGAITSNPDPKNLQTIKRQLPGGSRRLQIEVFAALIKSNEGTQLLINALENKEVPMDLLQVARVKSLVEERIKSKKDVKLEALLRESEGSIRELEHLLGIRELEAAKYKGNPGKGRVIFMNNCSSCHQIKGEGGMVGPQLDGIGNWGVKALTEKILSPNRNITEAFKTYQINLKSGEQKVGLYRRTEGVAMVFADHAGQEFRIPKGEIDDYFTINMSIMPDQFRYTIPEDDFYELITYLSSVK